MVVTRRPLFYGLCLLIGVLLSGIAGLMHPLLTGDGAAQLGIIARTDHWRAIHWSLLFGLAFMYTGLVGVALRHGETAGSAPGRAGVLLGAFGFSVWSLNILFMVAGWWVWGWQSIVIGALIVLASIPIYYYRTLIEDRRAAPAVGEARLT